MISRFELNNITKKITEGMITGIHALEIYAPLDRDLYGGELTEYSEYEEDLPLKWYDFGETVHMYYPKENKEMLHKYYPIADDNTIKFSFKRFIRNGGEMDDSTITIKLIFISRHEIYFMQKKSHYSDDCIVDFKTFYKDIHLIEIGYERVRAERIYKIYKQANAFLTSKERCYRMFTYCVGNTEREGWTEYSHSLFRNITRVVYYLYGKGEIPENVFKEVIESDWPHIYAIDDIFWGYWDEDDGSFDKRDFIFPVNYTEPLSRIEFRKMAEVLSIFYSLSQKDRDYMTHFIIANDLEIMEQFLNEIDTKDYVPDEEFFKLEKMTIQDVIDAM